MPVNQFLPFGLAAGANVLSQTDWANDPERLVGFARGVARSAKANTAWRQSSFVAAALAQMMMLRSGQDMLDNGDLTAFGSTFEAAMRGIMRDSGVRHLLTAPLELYVSTAGNDSNPGTQAEPFATLQRAWDYIATSLDTNFQTITVRVQPGIYTRGLRAGGPTVGFGWVYFVGSPANPSLTVINDPNAPAVMVYDGATLEIDGFAVFAGALGPTWSHGNWAVSGWDDGTIYARNLTFMGSFEPSGGGFVKVNNGSLCYLTGNNRVQGSITGGWNSTLFYATKGSDLDISGTCTIVGSPTMSWFVGADNLSIMEFGATIIGTLPTTTARYIVRGNSLIGKFTPGNEFPGGSPGVVDTGGIYQAGAWVVSSGRIVLSANTTLHVATSGSDDNQGSLAEPFATMTGAWNYIQRRLDTNGFDVRVEVAPGTYNRGLSAGGQILGNGWVYFVGSPSNPAAVVINDPIGPAIEAVHATIDVDGFSLFAGNRAGWPHGIWCLSAWDGATVYARNLIFRDVSNGSGGGFAKANNTSLMYLSASRVQGNILVGGAWSTAFLSAKGSDLSMSNIALTSTNVGVWMRADSLSMLQQGGSTAALPGTIKRYEAEALSLVSSVAQSGGAAGTTASGGLFLGT